MDSKITLDAIIDRQVINELEHIKKLLDDCAIPITDDNGGSLGLAERTEILKNKFIRSINDRINLIELLTQKELV